MPLESSAVTDETKRYPASTVLATSIYLLGVRGVYRVPHLLLNEGWFRRGVVLQEHRSGRPDVHPFLHGARAQHGTDGRLRC